MASTYRLELLLKVYRRREETAERALHAAREALIVAKSRFVETRKRWEEFRDWWPAQEDILFAEIFEQTIRQRKLDELKEQGQVWRNQENNLENEKEEAKVKVEEAREQVESCRIDYRNAVIKVRKIEIHREEWLQERAAEILAQEELEMEESYRSRAI